MICFRDTTFCISPNCTNKCGRKLTNEIQVAAKNWWRGCEGEPPIAVGYFCGDKPDGWPHAK